MGVWDKIIEVKNVALCEAGLHMWDPPIPVPGDPCSVIKHCSRSVHKPLKVTEHDYGDWDWRDATSCFKVQKCRRDGTHEVNESPVECHEWDDWQPVNSSDCRR